LYRSSAFFAHEETALYMLIANAIILGGFAILTRKMKPCKVKRINPLEMGWYFLAAWVRIIYFLHQF